MPIISFYIIQMFMAYNKYKYIACILCVKKKPPIKTYFSNDYILWI